MGRINELVSRGVRVVAGQPGEAAAEIPAEFFEPEEGRRLHRSELPADVAAFDAVYAEARVPEPFRGYGVDKLVEILENKRLAALPQDVRIAAALASLDAAGVSLAQVLRDAVLRERALDEFVAAKEHELEVLKSRGETHIGALREEMDGYVRERETEIEGLARAGESAQGAFSQLQLRKRQEEERLREVLAHFLEPGQNPLSPKKSAG